MDTKTTNQLEINTELYSSVVYESVKIALLLFLKQSN